jgi:hypothetical protein
VIIWLNGTFGVGKTSTADRLSALIPGARVFDPETVGAMLQANLADRPVPDFQDWPAWPPLVAASLVEIAKMTGQNVITPQTVLKRECLDQVLTTLRAAGQEVLHVVLDADEAVLRSRIEGADEPQSWRLDHLDEYQEARAWMVETADLVVDTAASTPPQIARRILAALPALQGEADAKKQPAAPKKAASPKAGGAVAGAVPPAESAAVPAPASQ